MPYDSARRQRRRLADAALHYQLRAYWYSEIAMTARDAGANPNALACQRRAREAARIAQSYVARLIATYPA